MIHIGQVLNKSFLDASPTDTCYAAVTHVLLDPSCSGSGISNTLDDMNDEVSWYYISFN